MNEQRDARTGEHPHMTSLIDLPSRRGAPACWPPR